QVVLFYDANAKNVHRSADGGKSWGKLEGVPGGKVTTVFIHPFDKDMAFLLTAKQTHYVSRDRGATWSTFRTPIPPTRTSAALSFHAERSGYVLFTGERCSSSIAGDSSDTCKDETYVTRDAFTTEPKLLLRNTLQCVWARSTLDSKLAPVKTIVCIEESARKGKYQLVRSENMFASKELVQLTTTTGSHAAGSVAALGTTNGFIVAAGSDRGTGDLQLWVTQDTHTWARAHLPAGMSIWNNEYTILESSAHTLNVDVGSDGSSSRPTAGRTGTLLSSNSNGTYYTVSLAHTSRTESGKVDYERVAGMEGVALVNVVDNWKTAARDDDRHIKSKITFDDGGSWRNVKPPLKDDQGKVYGCAGDTPLDRCSLHLHSVSESHNIGRVFSAPGAPGLLMGVGNVGAYLRPYALCDTFLSRDGGVTWRMVRRGPHKWEVGDAGGLLVMIADGRATDTVLWSDDDGTAWKTAKLDRKVQARALTTSRKGDTRHFVLVATPEDAGKNTRERHSVIFLDFTDTQAKQCRFDEEHPDTSDFELWRARGMVQGADCLMGHKTYYWRRRRDVRCYIGRRLDGAAKRTDCPCTEHDYECDYNFLRNGDGKCVSAGPERIPHGQCTKEGAKFTGSSGYRLITGNTCDRENGVKLDEPIEKDCPKGKKMALGSAYTRLFANHVSAQTVFRSMIADMLHFKNDPAMLLRTMAGELWNSKNEAGAWTRVSLDGAVIFSAVHEFDPMRAYAITDKDHLYVSKDRGATFTKVDTPLAPNKLGLSILDFHPTEPSWLLFTGSTDCPNCHSEVYLSKDDGANWKLVDTWAKSCLFGRDTQFTKVDTSTIYCIAYKRKSGDGQDGLNGKSTEDNPLRLQMTTDGGENWKRLMDRAHDMYIFSEFMLVTSLLGNDMDLYTSTDGTAFTPAVFPPNVNANSLTFTLLKSSSGAVFLDRRRRKTPGKEFGALFESNYNGTKFSLSLSDTNRNSDNIVDFERVSGISGVLVANQVANTDSLAAVDAKKQVVTRVSFNDGRTWQGLNAPSVDAQGRRIECANDCALHLHGKSSASNSGEVFSSPSSPGLMMGVGNVGDSLLPFGEGHTYLSNDAGQSWSEVKRGASLYEFGNYGSLLVMVDQSEPVRYLNYSWNTGKDWTAYRFSDRPIRVTELTTRPGSTSTRFILVGLEVTDDAKGPEDTQQIVIQVDFSQLEPRKCVKSDDDEKSDFERWNPLRSTNGNCFLGEEIYYWRRKEGRDCLIDSEQQLPTRIKKVCQCTIEDYECDSGFWFDSSGKCALLGLDPLRPRTCPHDSTYQGSSGYVKNPRSKCKGGEDLSGKAERKCNESKGAHAAITYFDHMSADHFYFEKSETIVMRTTNGEVWRSADEGKTWNRVGEDLGVEFTGVYRDPFVRERAIFVTANSKHYVTDDRGTTLQPLSVPLSPSIFDTPIFQFHPKQPRWLLYLGQAGCGSTRASKDRRDSTECQAKAFVSQNGGSDWKAIESYVRTCNWAASAKFSAYAEDVVLCEVYQRKEGSQRSFVDNPLQLVVGDKFFSNKQTVFDSITGFSLIDEFLMVAVTASGGKGLTMHVSTNARDFAAAQFPKGQNRALASVNRDNKGYVDFERAAGIEGVAMTNQVSNPAEVSAGEEKKLRSLITYDNGRTWKPLTAPKKDPSGRTYRCPSPPCSLSLHSFTEKEDPTNIFSAPTAVGVMMGVGNVGNHLSTYDESDTFLTRDAGHTWRAIQRGPHLYEFGDHGGILVLVDDRGPVDHVLYSLDEGASFDKFYFTPSNKKVRVATLTTEPSSTSRRFLLYGTAGRGTTRQVVVQLDFSGLLQRKCVLNMEDTSANDFELWSPTGNSKDHECLFGHVTQYVRRIPDHDCFIGHKFAGAEKQIRNCTCTSADFECDFNFVRSGENKCVLAEGITAPPQTTCDADGMTHVSTGYRKVPLSTCAGGLELDTSEAVACNGKHDPGMRAVQYC
ncbi:hypothetical protein THASP1DRAFT_13625, partial [Thamnocephalis sphaerospora]